MRTLTAKELQRMKKEQGEALAVINVLEPETFRAEHIPGSVNVPGKRDDFVKQVETEAGGKDRPVVVYCASASCNASPTAARKLDEAGFSRVYDFAGGMKAWRSEDLPTEGSETADTAEVRTVPGRTS